MGLCEVLLRRQSLTCVRQQSESSQLEESETNHDRLANAKSYTKWAIRRAMFAALTAQIFKEM